MLYSELGAVAQFERDVLRERTVAGLAAAKRPGERLGRPFALTPAQIREAKKMLARGESPNNVARVFRVGRSTLYRAIALSRYERKLQPFVVDATGVDPGPRCPRSACSWAWRCCCKPSRRSSRRSLPAARRVRTAGHLRDRRGPAHGCAAAFAL
jgi:Helix-turn-helix domain of resolvase